ncbi:MAG TPA: hypothetical protein VJJ76_01280 [archaeon]|nr:hypothetical protein [archaeon]
MPVEYELKVADARQRDFGRGIVRVDSKALDKALGIDVVSGYLRIRGKRATYARAFNGYRDDEGLGIIRTDGIIRKNAMMALGEKAYVSKANPQPAEIVVVSKPADERAGEVADSFIEEEVLDFLRKQWSDKFVVTVTDLIPLQIHGQPFTCRVLDYTPNAEAVEINEKSQILIGQPRKPRQPKQLNEYVNEMLKTMSSDGYRFRIPEQVLGEDIGELVEHRLEKKPY